MIPTYINSYKVFISLCVHVFKHVCFIENNVVKIDNSEHFPFLVAATNHTVTAIEQKCIYNKTVTQLKLEL